MVAHYLAALGVVLCVGGSLPACGSNTAGGPSAEDDSGPGSSGGSSESSASSSTASVGPDGAPVTMNPLTDAGPDADATTTDGDAALYVDGDATIDGSMTDGSLIDGSLIDGSMTDGSMTDGSMTDGSLIDGSLIDGSLIDGNVTDGSLIDGNVTDGYVGSACAPDLIFPNDASFSPSFGDASVPNVASESAPFGLVASQGFETGSPALEGTWVVDNSAAQAGTLSAHPPMMGADATSSLDYECDGQAHSQISFWYLGYAPAAGQNLNFYVDGALYKTYGQSPYNGFTEVVLTVPTGMHTYRWDATTAATVPGQPPYWVDSIQCLHTREALNTTGAFGFEEGFVPPEVTGAFVIDNSSAHSGSLAAHPPLLGADATASMNFSCGGLAHSQLSFWVQGYAPAAGQNLNFYVDGVLYKTFGQTAYNGFAQVILTVPTGVHTYRWDATTAPTVPGQPPYWIDDIQCVNVPVAENVTGAFGFEEGFVPPEITGSFVIDNSSAHTGSLAAHPPLLGASATASLKFSCGGKTHSQLSFWVQGYAPAAGQNLNFFVDGVLYKTYGQTSYNGFTQVVLTVPTGTHSYQWDATTAPTVPGQPPYWIDDIQCVNVPVAENVTGAFGFEEGFVPPEVTENFVIDNSSSHTGSLAAHPPLLCANSTASLVFSCGGKTHSQMSFWVQGYAPAAGQNLNFYVDGALYQTYGQTAYNGFTQVVLTVPTGQHTYRWDATTAPTVPGQPPYWIDDIECVNVPITKNVTGAFGLEEGFVPPEVTGDFVIDNSSAHTGSLATHPPILGADSSASLEFSCGGETHSQMSFWVQGYAPAVGQNLKFYVDEVLYKTYGQTPYNGFTQVILTVSTGQHKYRWDATTAPTVPGQPPYWIDDIQCVNVPVVNNTTGEFGFEEGFVPPEITGSFVIDNSSAHTGSLATHPPLMGANAVSSLDFSCGGKPHTQMSFWVQGYAPAAGQNLNFYVDEAPYMTYGQTPYNGYTQVVITSTSASTHTYRWDATTAPTVPGEPPYWIDDIQCLY
jgi:hypothetical protein